MATTTFTSNGTFVTLTALAVTMSAVGAGGAGSTGGSGGSGGSYAESYRTLKSGSYTIVVGQATATDGGNSYIVSGSGEILLRAPGGKQDGSIAHQEVLLTGSKYAYYGGYSADFQGYASYNGSGGGGGGGQTGNGGNGTSAFFSTPNTPASGGLGNATSGNGGAGAFYNAGASLNGVIPAAAGVFPGGGGGGSYDYGASTAGSGANGVVTIKS